MRCTSQRSPRITLWCQSPFGKVPYSDFFTDCQGPVRRDGRGEEFHLERRGGAVLSRQVSRVPTCPCTPVCTRVYPCVPVYVRVCPSAPVCVSVCFRVYPCKPRVLEYTRVVPVCVRVNPCEPRVYPGTFVCTCVCQCVPVCASGCARL